VDNVIYIGKESNNLEESEGIGVQEDDYVIYDDRITGKIMSCIKNLTPEKAKQIGISRRNLFYLKNRIKSGKQMVLKKKTLNKLTRIM
jgi:DNA-binding Xre family transcriptional regulator